MNNNWKEKLDKHLELWIESPEDSVIPTVKDFISTEIIEKLIEEATTLHQLEKYLNDQPPFEQQLRDKWL